MNKKLLIWLLGAVGLFLLVYGCRNMAAEMSYRERLYMAKCSSCHSRIRPERHDREKWRLYIDRYGGRMTDEEKRSLLQYLSCSR